MKRPLLIIGICLLLGAVVNVAVAWGCARWSNAGLGGAGVIWPTKDDPPVAAQRIWHRYAQEDWPPFDDYASRSGWGKSVEMLRSIAIVDVGGVTRFRMYFVSQSKAGWPLRTFQRGSSINAWDRRNVVEIMIPYAPLWPGFTINTIFYAAILWLLIPGPFVLRRFLRVRRGLCPKCAYPMGESAVCTECGKPLPSST